MNFSRKLNYSNILFYHHFTFIFDPILHPSIRIFYFSEFIKIFKLEICGYLVFALYLNPYINSCDFVEKFKSSRAYPFFNISGSEYIELILLPWYWIEITMLKWVLSPLKIPLKAPFRQAPRQFNVMRRFHLALRFCHVLLLKAIKIYPYCVYSQSAFYTV